jgi:hypothetical protein
VKLKTRKRPGILAAYLKDKEYWQSEIAWLRQPHRPDEYCAHCGEMMTTFDYYSYHARDSIWQQAGMRKGDLLHLACLEQRVGRPLTRKDIPALVSDGGYIAMMVLEMGQCPLCQWNFR